MSTQNQSIARFKRPPLTLEQFIASLGLIESTMAWLMARQISILGFGCTRLGPCITVAAHPAVYMAAKGTAERRSYQQVGALRHELWSFAARGGVDLLWEEVVCTH